jgi:copper(I)-binding protein
MRLANLLTTATLALLVLAPGAIAQQPAPSSVEISQAWSRATPAGAPVGVGYVTLTNHGGEADRLIGGSTEIADRIEVHEMSMDNGVMKMRELPDGLEVKPGATAQMKPGGDHLMLVGLKRSLREGERFKAQLEFAKSGKAEVEFVVQGLGAVKAPEAAAAASSQHHHH